MSALCLRTGGLLTRGLLIRTTGVLGGEGGSLGGERGWLLSLFENISDLKFRGLFISRPTKGHLSAQTRSTQLLL